VPSIVPTLSQGGAPSLGVGARPRTLALVVSSQAIEARMLGPTGAELARTRVTLPGDPEREIHALWPQLESIGEFDRIAVITRSNHEAWSSASTLRELERQSLRPARHVSLATLRWSHVIRRTGVELVVALGTELGSALFLDGVQVPGLDLGQLRVRKKQNLNDYLAPRVVQRKGVAAWNRRLARVAHELLAVWNPTALYLAIPKGVVVECELDPRVVCVTNPSDLAAAVTLWHP
jgi:polyphosphate glucokinase